MIEISYGAARVSKYASRESGDSLDVVERPNGGLCAALSDGQGSGKAARTLSSLVTARALGLVKDGVRDEAAALAANDYLLATRHGQVSATLVLLSADPAAGLVSIARNSACPVYVVRPTPPPAEDPANPPADAVQTEIAWAENAPPVTTVETLALDAAVHDLGLYRATRPLVTELALVAPMYVVAVSDGITGAGERYGARLDLAALVAERVATPMQTHLADPAASLPAADSLADAFLAAALARDKGRAADDMSVLVLRVAPAPETDAPAPRKLHISAFAG